MKMKKVLCGLIASVLVIQSASVAFATTPPDDGAIANSEAIVLDFDKMDMSKPFQIEKQYTNDQGEKVTVGVIYTPAPKEDSKADASPFSWIWSHTYDATEGTMTSYYDGSIISQMRYTYDLSKPAQHWVISNPRDLFVGALITDISNKSLVVNRSVSAIGKPAEITGSCTLRIGQTPIGAVSTVDAWIKTTISDDGKLTVSGN